MFTSHIPVNLATLEDRKYLQPFYNKFLDKVCNVSIIVERLLITVSPNILQKKNNLSIIEYLSVLELIVNYTSITFEWKHFDYQVLDIRRTSNYSYKLAFQILFKVVLIAEVTTQQDAILVGGDRYKFEVHLFIKNCKWI